jgi:[ribosomal protein S18]-alanine N-acetyltransferase
VSLPDGLHMRRAVPADLQDIMWLEHASFPTDAWSAAQMSAELYAPYTYYLVVETDAEQGSRDVVGYAGLSSLPGNPVSDVQTIAVAADRRGQGIGRVLFQELMDESRRRGVHEVFLEVRADNPVAQAMYTAFGFEQIAVRPRYYQPDGVDAWVMRTELTPVRTTGPIGQEAVDGEQ